MSAVLEARAPSARYLELAQPLAVSQFGLLTKAPGGVEKLRKLVLLLAVRGKLVGQDQRDTPAAELIRRIRDEKDTLVAAGKAKSIRPLASISESEEPYSLPSGWSFCRLGDLLLSIRSGGTPSKQNPSFWNGDIPWASVKDLRFGEPITHTQDRITKEGLTAGSELAPAGSILICTRMGLGKIGEALIDVAINQDLKAVLLGPGIVRSYFIYYFKTLAVVGSGMTVAGIRQDELLDFVVPVPPEAEQVRIVARVHELMRLCDTLEAKGRLEAEQHARLLATLLGTLTDSSTPEELAANWQRVADHFDLLLDRPEAVDSMEQTILQLAVRGLLVPQDASDEPATALMQRIRLVRENSDSSGRAKRSGSATFQAMIDQTFALPAGWMWSTLSDLCAITGGSTPSKAVANNWIGDIPWVSPKDMKVPVIEDAQDHVSSAALGGSLSLIASGSLLMVVRGMILAHSFPVAVTQVPVTINQDMKALTPIEPRLLPFLMLLCEGMKAEILALVDRSTHGTCKLESPKIFGLRVPLPPLAEQARILARVSELRRLCADLRLRLSVSQTTQSLLAEALVAEVA